MPDTGDAAEAPHWIRLQTSNWAATLPTMDEILVEYHRNIYIYIYCFMLLTHYHLPITNGIIVIIYTNHYCEPVLIIIH